jgi:hypothetical protein
VRMWDLHSGATQIEQALRLLQKVRKDLEETWDDENFRQFCEKYVLPAEMRARQMLDQARRMAQIMADARRDCED